MAVQGRFKRNREGKYLDGSRENEKRKKKVRKKKEDINYAERKIDFPEEFKIVTLQL